MTRFLEFFHQRTEHCGFTTEDALTSLLPLVRQTVAAHAAGLVAPLQGLESLQVDGVRIFFEDVRRSSPTLQPKAIRALDQADNRAIEIIGESRFDIQVSAAQESITSLQIGEAASRSCGRYTCPVTLAGSTS